LHHEAASITPTACVFLFIDHNNSAEAKINS
jgi:hypothetical protein